MPINIPSRNLPSGASFANLYCVASYQDIQFSQGMANIHVNFYYNSTQYAAKAPPVDVSQYSVPAKALASSLASLTDANGYVNMIDVAYAMLLSDGGSDFTGATLVS